VLASRGVVVSARTVAGGQSVVMCESMDPRLETAEQHFTTFACGREPRGDRAWTGADRKAPHKPSDPKDETLSP
jgi:hypothetical protein